MDLPTLTQFVQEIEKHISVLNEDYTKMAIDVAVLKSQMGEVIWWFKTVVGALIILLVSQIWQIIIMHKRK